MKLAAKNTKGTNSSGPEKRMLKRISERWSKSGGKALRIVTRKDAGNESMNPTNEAMNLCSLNRATS